MSNHTHPTVPNNGRLYLPGEFDSIRLSEAGPRGNWRRIIVCGGRLYNDRYSLYKTLDWFRFNHFDNKFFIIQGGAKGADTLAKDWAFSIPVPVMQFDAPWTTIGNSAGAVRNKWMLDYGDPDIVIAFPGGDGTNNMIEAGRNHHIPVFEMRE
jgi:hypothetical protein